ncbi:LysR family transcriptional regulator [Acidovorax sp. D2M1]|uniref:LysR family transcriptional regulator n=1 Tax=Acidovorax benzenivorans TaxID=2987520 RepID=A0ABT5RRF3_9BURK|nr:LysR family transcriptional regulator [Acidovorax benzenivorans]MDD2176269.1 LysR family transcriptional regulator [Acidovorax benzenivorans]
MSERLQGLDIFVAAVESGSFARAATRLHLTRSAVGKGVARLESRLGARLFHRTTRSQALTDEGQRYYERCRRALDELDAAEAAVQAGREEVVGRLRLTCPELIGRRCVGPVLLALACEHPHLVVEAHFSDRPSHLIDEGLDLAIRSGPLPDSTQFAARLLGHQWMGVYASAGYLATHLRPAGLAELADTRDQHTFVVYGSDGWAKPWLFTWAGGRTFELEVTPRFTANSLEVLAQAATEGMGLVRLPTWLAAPAVASGTLEQVFEEAMPFGYPLHALWPQLRSMPTRQRMVIDTLAQRLPELINVGQGIPRAGKATA